MLPYPVLSCPVLSYLILFHPITSFLFHAISSDLILSRPILSYRILCHPIYITLSHPLTLSHSTSAYLTISSYLSNLFSILPHPILSYPNPIPSYLPYLSYLSYLCFLSYLILSVPIQQHTTHSALSTHSTHLHTDSGAALHTLHATLQALNSTLHASHSTRVIT